MTSGFSGEMMKEITKISIHTLTEMSLIIEVNTVEGMQETTILEIDLC